jgi:hypothetical protein
LDWMHSSPLSSNYNKLSMYVFSHHLAVHQIVCIKLDRLNRFSRSSRCTNNFLYHPCWLVTMWGWIGGYSVLVLLRV